MPPVYRLHGSLIASVSTKPPSITTLRNAVSPCVVPMTGAPALVVGWLQWQPRLLVRTLLPVGATLKLFEYHGFAHPVLRGFDATAI
jgi:hypothetical protein